MRTAIRICLKDLKHLWLFTSLTNILFFLCARLDVLSFLHPERIGRYFIIEQYLGSLASLVLCIMTVLAVQADPLTGDRQFWLTRPISWQSLLAGKLIFLICTVNIPLLIYQAAAMVVIDISPIRHLPVLLEKQLLLGLLLASSALLASIMKNLRQAVLAFLAIGVGFMIFETLSRRYFGLYNITWGSAEDLRTLFTTIVILLLIALVLLLQYSKRSTRSAIVLFVLVAGLFLMSDKLAFQCCWLPAARYRARSADILSEHPRLSVVFLNRQPAVNDATYGMTPNDEGFMLPVRVSGIPEGRTLINERINISVTTRSGLAWKSGWTGDNSPEVIGLNIDLQSFKKIHADGDYQLTAYVHKNFYDRVKDIPVQIRVSLACGLYGSPQKALLQEDRLSPVFNEIGFCGSIRYGGVRQPVCLFSKRPSVSINYQGKDLFIERWGLFTSIWSFRTRGSQTAEPVDNFLSARQEEMWFETTFEIPEALLRDYSSGRIH
jgi:hypothetical protein